MPDGFVMPFIPKSLPPPPSNERVTIDFETISSFESGNSTVAETSVDSQSVNVELESLKQQSVYTPPESFEQQSVDIPQQPESFEQQSVDIPQLELFEMQNVSVQPQPISFDQVNIPHSSELFELQNVNVPPQPESLNQQPYYYYYQPYPYNDTNYYRTSFYEEPPRPQVQQQPETLDSLPLVPDSILDDPENFPLGVMDEREIFKMLNELVPESFVDSFLNTPPLIENVEQGELNKLQNDIPVDFSASMFQY